MLSSLWGLSCHILHGVKVTIIVTTAALGRATEWRGISHMPRVAFSFREVWLGPAAVAVGEICLDDPNTGTPDPVRMDSEL